MLIFISPAKTLDFKEAAPDSTQLPYFIEEAEKINRSLRRKSRKGLIELQAISRPLAELNYQRNQQWSVEHHRTLEARPAVLAFQGDVYQGLQAGLWDQEDRQFAAEHLYILSGLYGLLRPEDSILPYRLEMGTSLKVGRRENLYHFWADKLKTYFKKHVAPETMVVNLASNEYFKALQTAKISNPILTISFKDFSKDQYKVVSFFAKKARGMMADFIIRNRIYKPEAIKAFNGEGYYYDESQSSQMHYVFLRD